MASRHWVKHRSHCCPSIKSFSLVDFLSKKKQTKRIPTISALSRTIKTCTRPQMNSVRTLLDKRSCEVFEISQCNMIKPMKSVLFVMIVVAYFAIGGAIHCYECQSRSSVDCGIVFDKDGTGVTEVECGHCVKILSATETIRGCNGSKLAPAVETPFRAPLEFSCYSDLCNGVSPIAAALSTFMAPIAVLIVGAYN